MCGRFGRMRRRSLIDQSWAPNMPQPLGSSICLPVFISVLQRKTGAGALESNPVGEEDGRISDLAMDQHTEKPLGYGSQGLV